ncbi:CPBP family intramembrane metalloprotease [Clostridium sp. CM028]|uniref:CPBP family intramembrane glutamic endopeptidase n=1 Tax=unclassified Clostridium TaxID=2614128 RepID=UPI001C0BC821|nr:MULTISPECIES: type II CAAX endopeptidase family protein [unclassified Clostridium]MBU3093306.1 CPBP family intramembrane metalloprotease [Clostridium sp. CF011]MBW9146716.1 CPBP family intramembrane metalloprotease [Clostridium sp. CM027]MBW9148143.1 CPBP family intramembrane metalloprotease [Clostridium sp. CM028]UVE41625.1 CPBP family intramembrane metalloprotease [Clostridium sp. CM027]WAG70618.1 CPBP family intramembrane metalloprotease [Clostridium sp. CF011]
MKKVNRNLKIVAVSFVNIILAAFVWYVITLISRKFGLKLLENNFINYSGLEISILIGQYFVIKKYNNGRVSFDFIDMKFKQNSFKQLFIGIGIGTLMYFARVLILSVIKIVKFKGIGFMFYPTNEIIVAIISAFVTCAIVGFTEEILYRGIILKHLMQFKGKVVALIISSLIFTIFHTQYYQQFHALFVVFIMGILLGYLYIITESLYLPIGLHFVVDFYSFITGESNNFLLFDIKISNLVFSLYFDYVTIIVIIILILILAVYKFKHKKLSANT